MNLKQLSILIALVVLVGGLGLHLYQRRASTWQASERAADRKLMGDFPLNDVAQVTIKKDKGELNLIKQDDRWKVKERYNYPANFSEISDVIRKTWELKGVQPVAVGKSMLARLELTEPGQGTNSGTLVEFKDKGGKLIRPLLLGKKHMRESGGASPFGDMGGWPDGRFVLVAGTNTQAAPSVWVVSEPFSNVETKPEIWLNKDFIKVEKLRSVSVTTTNATNDWKLSRDTEAGEMKLMDRKGGEELDPSKASSVNYVLSSPSFNDVLAPDTKFESIGLDKPLVANLETFDNFVYTVQFGKSTNDESYPFRFQVTADLPKERVAGKDEKPEDKARLDKEFKEKNDKLKAKLDQEKALEKWTYVVSKWTVDALLKSRSELLKEAKKDESKSDAAKGQPPQVGDFNLDALNLGEPAKTAPAIEELKKEVITPIPVIKTDDKKVEPTLPPAPPKPEDTNAPAK